jgi:hypothetical protein
MLDYMTLKILPINERDLQLVGLELKACPFCGSKAFASGIFNQYSQIWQYRVSCMNHHCFASVAFNSRDRDDACDNAIKNWQKRI